MENDNRNVCGGGKYSTMTTSELRQQQQQPPQQRAAMQSKTNKDEDTSYTPEDEIASLDSTPIKDMPSPLQDESDMYKYIDKIAYLILNNLPLRLKHLIKLRRLEEVRVWRFSSPAYQLTR